LFDDHHHSVERKMVVNGGREGWMRCLEIDWMKSNLNSKTIKTKN